MTSYDLVQLLLDVALKATVILLLAFCLHWLLPQAPAASRHSLWMIAICACLSLPLLTAALPEWHLPIMPATSSRNVVIRSPLPAPLVEIKYAPPMEAYAVDPTPQFLRQERLKSSINWSVFALTVWAIGLCLVLAYMLFGWLSIGTIRRHAERWDDDVSRDLLVGMTKNLHLKSRVTLLLSDDISVPLTTGIWRPVVLLPVAALHWSRKRLLTILLHEGAHIKCRDCLTQMLALLACSLYWWNPLVWFAARQMHKLREMACDDEALMAGVRATDYASCLIDVAKSVDAPPYSSPVAAGMACSELTDRVKTILDPSTNRRKLSRRTLLMMTILVACLLVPLAALQPYSQAAAATVVQTTTPPPSAPQSVQQRIEAEKQRHELENHLREIEKHRQQITEVHQREIAQHLRALERLQAAAQTAEVKEHIAAELERAASMAATAQEQAVNVQLRATSLEVELQAQLNASEKIRQETDAATRHALQIEWENALRAQRESAEVSKGQAELKLRRAELEAELQKLRRNYKETHPSVLEMRDQFNALQEEILRIEARRAPVSEGQAIFTQRLAELEAKLKTLQRTYTDKHPAVMAAKEQLEALRREFERLLRK